MKEKYDYNTEDYRRKETGINNKLAFLLIGGGIGAAVALLLAPKSGHELRQDIADVTGKGVDKTRESARQLGERSGVYYEEAKNRASDAYKRAGGAYSAAVGELRRKSGLERSETEHSSENFENRIDVTPTRLDNSDYTQEQLSDSVLEISDEQVEDELLNRQS